MDRIVVKVKNYFLIVLIIMALVSAHANVKINNLPSVKTSSVSVANHKIFYDSLGEGSNVILLHGLFGSKNQWTVFAEILAQNGYHVIIPDLPGYGKSVGFPEEYYAIAKEVELINEFAMRLNLDKFAIAGNSMGGLIAAKYAQKYPNKVSSLAFIGAPLGIKTPKASKTDNVLRSGENPFIPLTTQQFNQEMQLLFTTPPKLSDEQVQKRVTRYQEERDKDLRIWSMIEKDSNVLNSPFKIEKPTLIVWGDNDNIYDVSGAEVLKNNIKNSELIVIKNGSHLLFIENPISIATNYLNFLKRSSEKIYAN